MKLEIAIKGMLDAETALRSTQGIYDPVFMSENMQRLSQYTGAVEERLAELERDFEVEYAVQLKEYLIDQKLKVTEAERKVTIYTAEQKAQIKYLTRIVASAWRQVGVVQSRINHLVREAGTQL